MAARLRDVEADGCLASELFQEHGTAMVLADPGRTILDDIVRRFGPNGGSVLVQWAVSRTSGHP